MFDADVIIIGGGAAGLTCAKALQKAGMKWLLLERSDRLGGRLRTDLQDGYTLDHGFHVIQPKYPELKGVVDVKMLKSRPFARGAKIFHDARWHTIAHPFKHPAHALGTLFSSLATFGDMRRLGWWTFRTRFQNSDSIWEGNEIKSIDRLREQGFSETFIQSFFRPFFGGVSLDPDLQISARQMEFAFRSFLEAAPVLPQGGIASLVPYLSAELPPERIRLSTEVVARDGQILHLADGSTLRGFQIVIATENTSAQQLIGAKKNSTAIPFVSERATSVFYFEAPNPPPVAGPWLLLNGEPGGPVLHGCFPSQVQPSYAPKGKQLFSATAVGPVTPDLEAVRTQMADWFGEEARAWPHLRTIHVPRALPRRESLRPAFLPERLSDELFVCGDHRAYPSLNAAIASGRRAADVVIPETVF